MTEHKPHKISLNELEEAVTAAVHQLQQRKTHGAQEIAQSRLIIGRWIQQHIPQPEAHAAAEEITKQVTAKLAGLKADPVAASFPGGSTMGFVIREQ